jgi:hypothetical protein
MMKNIMIVTLFFCLFLLSENCVSTQEKLEIKEEKLEATDSTKNIEEFENKQPEQKRDEIRNWSSYQGIMNYSKAENKCKSLKMRLPTLAELKLAHDEGITSEWKENANGYFSSDKFDNNLFPGLHFVFDLNMNDYYHNGTTNSLYHVRCHK